jgi:hypothetical protein
MPLPSIETHDRVIGVLLYPELYRSVHLRLRHQRLLQQLKPPGHELDLVNHLSAYCGEVVRGYSSAK